ncbi:MAG: hypothetical protein DRI46_02210 [Chloroflexi bacterium]|nr:MAG: hypothetical protein DRI46_02210 [Chloroflexota bacterium]
MPFARLLAVVFALFGLIAGILYAFRGLIYDLALTGSVNPGTALAFMALIGMPLILTLAGLIIGLVGGWLFNHFSRWLDRLDMNLDFLDD